MIASLSAIKVILPALKSVGGVGFQKFWMDTGIGLGNG